VTAGEAKWLVKQARGWQRAFRSRIDRGFVYLGDELYLLAGEPLPPARSYDGFRQLQNGVGLTRLMLEDWKRSRGDLPAAVSARRVAWLCGRAASYALRTMAAELETVSGLQLEVLEVPNDFFGGSISVSGLLAGQDIVQRLQGQPVDLAILPRSAFGFEGSQTLDGWSPERLEQAAGQRLALASTAAELARLTLGG
jgi:NifB/MoaA-like Fe-S oxidoreductase